MYIFRKLLFVQKKIVLSFKKINVQYTKEKYNKTLLLLFLLLQLAFKFNLFTYFLYKIYLVKEHNIIKMFYVFSGFWEDYNISIVVNYSFFPTCCWINNDTFIYVINLMIKIKFCYIKILVSDSKHFNNNLFIKV